MPTSDEILESMQKSVEAQDSGVDVRKGPLLALMLRPVAGEVAPIYDTAARLGTLYSKLAYGTEDQITAQDLDAIGRNLRVSKPAGRRANGLVYFWFTTPPSDTVEIPAGTVVTTKDRSLVYTTLGTVSVNYNTVSQYYNAQNSRYEIPVTVQAASEGSIYNVPAYIITRISSTIAGISGVYNPSATLNGEDPSDSQDYLARIRTRFLGRDRDAVQGILSDIQQRYGKISLNFISGNTPGFRRPMRGKGLDLIVQTPKPEFQEDLFIVTGENEFLLSKHPLIAVDSVTADGVVTQDYEILADTSRKLGGSAKAQDRIRVNAKAGSNIRVRYTYCSACDWIQKNVLDAKSSGYFGLDALARLATPKQIAVTVKVSTSSATSGLLASLISEIRSYVSLNSFGVCDPAELRSVVITQHPEIRVFNITQFSYGASEVKQLSSDGYDSLELAESNLNINFTT